jgi:hypothetical protein
MLVRLRGLENAVRGREIDLLHPFEDVRPIEREMQPEKAGPLRNWLVYHQAFLLEHPKVSLSILKAVVLRLREVEQRIDAWMA